MAIARVASRAQLGLAAPRVDVEVHLGSGLPTFSIVGLPETAVKESKDRVRAALANAGFEFPAGRITVNLSPADLPKEGCRYDLPIALGILHASSQLPDAGDWLASCEFYGELGLAGELKPIKGVVLAAAHAARDSHGVVVPEGNVQEARLAAPAAAVGAGNLLSVCELFTTHAPTIGARQAPPTDIPVPRTSDCTMDLADVCGQALGKRALVIAAAGGHSMLLIGPPGTGKTMLAQRLPGLLPGLPADQALDVASIASVSSRGFDACDYGRRPFRAPHHSASASAIIGGGPKAWPGEVSLAHRGVLFLDELPEFDRRVLESLREPLESGFVAVSRAALQVEYPARFQLVAAMNPCPCGYLGDVSGKCRCAPPEIARYRARISGPLLDRIDLRVEVATVPDDELLAHGSTQAASLSSATIAERVCAVRELQLERSGKLNAELTAAEMKEYCRIDRQCCALLAQARARLHLSARGIHRVLRVARTIADLDDALAIAPAHLAEALQMRRAINP